MVERYDYGIDIYDDYGNKSPFELLFKSHTNASEIIYSKNDIKTVNSERHLELFSCIICANIAIKPYVCSACGCSMCTLCFDKWSITKKLCPNKCNSNYIPSNDYQLIKKVMKCFDVYCPECKSAGIDKLISYHDLYNHIDTECENKKYQCKKCDKLVIKKNCASHTNECALTKKSCKYCHKLLFNDRLEDHLSTCDYQLIFCEDCELTMKFTEFKKHSKKECVENVKNMYVFKIREKDEEIQRSKIDLKMENSNLFIESAGQIEISKNINPEKLLISGHNTYQANEDILRNDEEDKIMTDKYSSLNKDTKYSKNIDKGDTIINKLSTSIVKGNREFTYKDHYKKKINESIPIPKKQTENGLKFINYPRVNHYKTLSNLDLHSTQVNLYSNLEDLTDISTRSGVCLSKHSSLYIEFNDLYMINTITIKLKSSNLYQYGNEIAEIKLFDSEKGNELVSLTVNKQDLDYRFKTFNLKEPKLAKYILIKNKSFEKLDIEYIQVNDFNKYLIQSKDNKCIVEASKLKENLFMINNNKDKIIDVFSQLYIKTYNENSKVFGSKIEISTDSVQFREIGIVPYCFSEKNLILANVLLTNFLNDDSVYIRIENGEGLISSVYVLEVKKYKSIREIDISPYYSSSGEYLTNEGYVLGNNSLLELIDKNEYSEDENSNIIVANNKGYLLFQLKKEIVIENISLGIKKYNKEYLFPNKLTLFLSLTGYDWIKIESLEKDNYSSGYCFIVQNQERIGGIKSKYIKLVGDEGPLGLVNFLINE